MVNEKNLSVEANKYNLALCELKVACYEKVAVATHFEKAIKICGLTMEIMNIMRSYYVVDLQDYALVDFGGY